MIVAGCDSSVDFEVAEHALDAIALAIEALGLRNATDRLPCCTDRLDPHSKADMQWAIRAGITSGNCDLSAREGATAHSRLCNMKERNPHSVVERNSLVRKSDSAVHNKQARSLCNT